MTALLQLSPDTIFAGDYRVVRPLSEGGMGAVYVVEQASTGKQRALKIMHPQLVTNEKLRQRFEQEARIGARIESDHVVQVLGAGVEPKTGTPWLVMELLKGQTLGELLAQHRVLPVPVVREVFTQLCHALGAAHRQGIVHRDLKPENIFLEVPKREGVPFTVKILDFGIAKMVAEAGTNHTAAIGTPLWMAPEQTESRSIIGPPTDVWALGLIAFYLLTGRMYWREANVDGGSSMVLMREIVIDPLPTASARAKELGVAQHVPATFDAWFGRCVVRDPAQRFRDAGEARKTLDPALSQPPLVPTREPRADSPVASAVTRVPTEYAPPPTPPVARTLPMGRPQETHSSTRSNVPLLAGLTGGVIALGLLAYILGGGLRRTSTDRGAPVARPEITAQQKETAAAQSSVKPIPTTEPAAFDPSAVASYEEALKSTAGDPDAEGISVEECSVVGGSVAASCGLTGSATAKFLVKDGHVQGVTVTSAPNQPGVNACMSKAIARTSFRVAKGATGCIRTFKTSDAPTVKAPAPFAVPETEQTHKQPTGGVVGPGF